MKSKDKYNYQNYKANPSPINDFVELFQGHRDLLSRIIARYTPIIETNDFQVNSQNECEIKMEINIADEKLTKNSEYILNASLEIIKFLITQSLAN